MLTRILLLCFAFCASFIVAQIIPICTVLQCTFSYTPMTIGVGLQINDKLVQFLPGEYSSSVVQSLLLQNLLTSQTSIVSTPGYKLSSAAPPFNITLEQEGFVLYPNKSYGGSANFYELRDSFSKQQAISLSDNVSISVSDNSWVAVLISLSEKNKQLFMIYDTAPAIPFPSTSQSIIIVDFQSSACNPPCSGSGVCTASGICACDKGFTGPSCETCAPGLFGPTCKPCPCKDCGQKYGSCLTPKKASKVKRAQETLKCQNGELKNGKCICLPGWTNPTCGECAPGFYLTDAGNCEVCQLGCLGCKSKTGNCNFCAKGFTQDPTDKTKCNANPTVTKDKKKCPDGSYSTGEQCTPCSPPCSKCNGGLKNDCTECNSKNSMYLGNCVLLDSEGVCAGTNGLIANNDKKMCDSCGLKCKACKITDFSRQSTINQAQCTSCLPGSVLKNGKCVSLSCQKGQFASGSSCHPCSSVCATCSKSANMCLTCPEGRFLSKSGTTNQFLSESGSTCKPCSPLCHTCSGTSTNCLTCAKYRLASSGECVSNCPDGTFGISNICASCHGDCLRCSGSSFDQCTGCPPDRPVLNEGRCLRGCDKGEFYDSATSSCRKCNPSCSSCFGAGPDNCLACSDPNAFLNNGGCATPAVNYFAFDGIQFHDHLVGAGPVITEL